MAKSIKYSINTIDRLRNVTSNLYVLGIIWFVIISIAAAMYIQFVNKDLPCPLCLLQRLCFFGIGFGALLPVFNYDKNIKYRSFGIILLFILLLEIISIRHSLINICPRANHQWLSNAFLGLRIPLWSLVLSLFGILGIAVNFLFIQSDNQLQLNKYPLLLKITKLSAILLLIILVINLIAIFLQCGLEQCHTYSYVIVDRWWPF